MSSVYAPTFARVLEVRDNTLPPYTNLKPPSRHPFPLDTQALCVTKGASDKSRDRCVVEKEVLSGKTSRTHLSARSANRCRMSCAMTKRVADELDDAADTGTGLGKECAGAN